MIMIIVLAAAVWPRSDVVGESRRYCAMPMVKLQRRSFGDPDDVREIPYGQLETYDMGVIRIGRSILQPGWRWSESVKPIARTELCESHHIGICVSSSARIRMREGAELLVPGRPVL
jgi:hypothetical protein